MSVGPICIASEWNEGLPSVGQPLDPLTEALERYRVPWLRGSHQWDVSTPMADRQSPLDQGLGGQGNVKCNDYNPGFLLCPHALESHLFKVIQGPEPPGTAALPCGQHSLGAPCSFEPEQRG